MRKGETVTGALSGVSFLAAADAYAGTGTSSWLADICFSGDAPAPMIEGMPMEGNHSKHAAYFASAGLTFLAGALGWEYAETQVAKWAGSKPQGVKRKRMLACIIYVSTAADCANKQAIESTFKSLTGQSLEPDEAKSAFDALMCKNAPELQLILGGATKRERKALLHAAVQTWATHGMDSEQATAVTEHIVDLLEFDQDDMCAALDRLWLKEQANSGLRSIYKTSLSTFKSACRATLAGAKNMRRVLAPHARRLTARAFVAIKR